MSLSKQQNEERLLREIYFQVAEGGTPSKIGEDEVWIKHFAFSDQCKIDRYYNLAFDEASQKGVPTKEESLNLLLKEGLWTDEEENEIVALEARIEKLRVGLAKALNSVIAEGVSSQIKVEKEKLAEKAAAKSKLISHTCEDIADSRSNDFVVEISFKKNREGDPYYNKEEFSMLERGEILDLVKIYNDSIGKLNTESIKKIAAADFFVSLFSLVDESPASFFGKTIPSLTFFQINLLSYAKIVSNITKNFTPPDHIRNDTNALIAFAKSENKKAQKKDRGANKTPQGLISKKV